MSKWFSDVSEREGADEAVKMGFFGSLAVAAMNVLGLIILLTTNELPATGEYAPEKFGAAIGIVLEMSICLIAAWRFKIGKGLVWGSIVTLIFVFEVFTKVTSGTTNFGWMIAYAAILVALINGIRGAWSLRNNTFEDEEEWT